MTKDNRGFDVCCRNKRSEICILGLVLVLFAIVCIFIGDVMSSFSDGGCPEHHKTL